MQKFSDIVTIAIPVYERYIYFEDAINSALNQTMICNIIVVDNCSSHNKFFDFVNNLNNDRVIYYKNETNLGMTANWNKCLDLADTEWVSILHDDDMLYPNFVECFELTQKHYPNCSCIATSSIHGEIPNKNIDSIQRIDALNVRTVDKIEFFYSILSHFPGIVVNKKICNIHFDNSQYPIADFDFWFRLSKFGEVKQVLKVQAFYRVDKNQTTFKVVDGIIKSSYALRKKEFKNADFWSYLLFLIETSSSVMSSRRKYGAKIDFEKFVEKKDINWIRLLKYKIILYPLWLIKKIYLKYNAYYSSKKILNQ